MSSHVRPGWRVKRRKVRGRGGVVAAIAAVSLASAGLLAGGGAAVADSGGTGGTDGGTGGDGSGVEFYLRTFDDYRVYNEPSQGWGQASIDWWKATIAGDAGTSLSSQLDNDIQSACTDAVNEAIARSNGAASTARVVGLQFSYKPSSPLSDYGVMRSSHQTYYDANFPAAVASGLTPYNYSSSNVDFVNSLFAEAFSERDPASTRLVCVALNSQEPEPLAFQPAVRTQVETKFMEPGPVVDWWEWYAANDAAGNPTTWVEGTTVSGESITYGPLDREYPPGVIPADAPIAVRSHATATGPGRQKVTSEGEITVRGIYTTVVTIDKAKQSPETQARIIDSFTDGFFTEGETSIIEMGVVLSTDVPDGYEAINPGGMSRDCVTLSPPKAGDLWFAEPDGTPIQYPLVGVVGQPSASVQAPGTPLSGNPVSTTKLTFTGYGTQCVDTGTLGASGFYPIQWRTDTAALSDVAKHYLADEFEDIADEPWDPDEIVLVRMTPDVVTATAKLNDAGATDAGFPATTTVDDAVTVSLPAGHKWVNDPASGNPVPYEVGTSAVGVYDMDTEPLTQRPATLADLARELGSATTTFTEPGTKTATHEVTVDGPGAVTIYAHNNPSASTITMPGNAGVEVAVVGYESDIFIPEETVSFREQPGHASESKEMNLPTAAGIAKDDMQVNYLSDHTKFEGGNRFGPDTKVAHVRIYKVDATSFTDPVWTKGYTAQGWLKTGTPFTGEPVWEMEIPATDQNLRNLGMGNYEELFGEQIASEIFEPGAYYAWGYEVEGDDRVIPYSTGVQINEGFYVPPPETPFDPRPSIDIEKTDTGLPPNPGKGMYADALNNKGERDADTPETAKLVGAGSTTEVYFRWENTGNVPLGNITVLDETLDGPAVSEIVWDEPIPEIVPPGYVGTGKATLVLEAGQTHADNVTVTGTPVCAGDDGEYGTDDDVVPGPGPDGKPGTADDVTCDGALDPVGDDDPWHAKATVASIDIEKSSSDFVEPGAGNGSDEPNNRNDAGTDADTPETAVQVAAGDDVEVFFRVTNNGSENLVNIEVADTTLVGDREVAITWDEIPDVLAPGESFTGKGVLPALEAGELHGDEVTVTAEGESSKTPVTDVDQWYGKVPGPGIDVEKSSGAAVAAGLGNGLDQADNRNQDGTDADTEATAVTVKAGESTEIFFRITNTGDEDLTDIRVEDVTIKGDVTVSVDWKDIPEVLKPGESVVIKGTLPELPAGSVHADKVTVTAKAVTSGATVGDEDQWWAGTAAAAVSTAAAGMLAHTGASIGVALALAVLLLAGGTAVLIVRRRRLARVPGAPDSRHLA